MEDGSKDDFGCCLDPELGHDAPGPLCHFHQGRLRLWNKREHAWLEQHQCLDVVGIAQCQEESDATP